jgi:hypothetical protein
MASKAASSIRGPTDAPAARGSPTWKTRIGALEPPDDTVIAGSHAQTIDAQWRNADRRYPRLRAT